jgi:hypothetical protein
MTDMKTLPIGTQSFEVLRSSDFLYVYKTEHIHRLITNSRVAFLSRPRRFGKYLLISTLKELFKGNQPLLFQVWMTLLGFDIQWKRRGVQN